MTTRINVIRDRPNRHPFVIVLALLSLGAGLSMLVGGPKPNSIAQLLPFPMLMFWAFGLVAVGVGFLLAASIRDDGDSELVEAWACFVGVLAILAYIVAAAVTLGAGALVLPIAYTVAYGIGCGWRLVQIVRRVRRRAADLGT